MRTDHDSGLHCGGLVYTLPPPPIPYPLGYPTPQIPYPLEYPTPQIPYPLEYPTPQISFLQIPYLPETLSPGYPTHQNGHGTRDTSPPKGTLYPGKDMGPEIPYLSKRTWDQKYPNPL